MERLKKDVYNVSFTRPINQPPDKWQVNNPVSRPASSSSFQHVNQRY